MSKKGVGVMKGGGVQVRLVSKSFTPPIEAKGQLNREILWFGISSMIVSECKGL